jgi:class 3 adenylate cyclase/tetratricopeptide (TPR) repeat protein
MKCPRCQQESPPQARFCLECAAPLAPGCANCGTQLPAGAKFCFECATPVSAPGSPPRFASPETYTPKHLAERIINSKAALEGERKQVTVLFADLKGSMELLADRDPEEARKILDPVLHLMMDAVHHYEGTVNQVMGDGIMALFGAPLAHEDHAVRACYAALRMQAAVGRYGEELRRGQGLSVQIRVGLNSGDVVVRAIGSDLHMDYTAVGQTTHLAARMEQLAAPGSILLTAATLRLAESFVQVKPLGLVPVKGIEAPIEVYEVTGTGPVRRRLQAAAVRGLTRFVGRDAELHALRQALENAREGHGQVVAVVGEPGVGKSRLFREFVHSHRTHGWLVLESGSVSYGKAAVYLPVSDLLKAYFKVHERDAPREIREKVTGKLLTLDRALELTLPALLPLLDLPVEDPGWETLDPRQRRERTLEALRRLLLRESQVQPLCLVFEDLHWIDAETQLFLDDLIESLDGARLLLLVNYRPEYQHGWASKTYYTQIRIDPLSPEDAGALLGALLGDNAAMAPVAQLLIERTEGNPFFLEESVRMLAETQILAGEQGAYRLARALPGIQVPSTVQAVLAARIDRLASEDKRLLQAAAVIGKDVPFTLLRAIGEMPEDEVRSGLGHLQAAEFLYEARLFPDLAYSFKHALTHEVAYGELVQERRKALHAKVIEAIERLTGERRTEHAETLARHAVRGELWDKAVDFLSEAGAKAFASGAVQESLVRHERALEIIPRLPACADTIRRAIDVRSNFFQPLISLGQVPRIVQLLREAEKLGREIEDQPRLGRISVWMGACSLMSAEYAVAIEYGRQALDIATTTGDPELRIGSSYLVAVSHSGLGEYRKAIDWFTRFVEGPDADPARRLAGAFGSVYAMGCAWLAECYSRTGDFERGQEYGDRAVQVAEASDIPQAQAFAYLYRANPLLLKGEFADALPWLERAVHLCEMKGLPYLLSAVYVNWGFAAAWSGRSADGCRAIERGVTFQESMGIKTFLSYFYVAWAEGLLLDGQTQEAKRAADRALELAGAVRERASQAWALQVLGEIAAFQDSSDFESAALYCERAKALAEELGLRPLLARCHLGLGKLYRRTGKREQALEHLTTATTMYREMGMTYWLEKAGAEMRELR